MIHVPTNGGGNKRDPFVSAGLFLSILIATVLLLNSLNNTKTDIATRLTKLELAQADLVTKLTDLSTKKSDWNYSDMFKWAVKLQRDNPNIKVPDPQQDKP